MVKTRAPPTVKPSRRGTSSKQSRTKSSGDLWDSSDDEVYSYREERIDLENPWVADSEGSATSKIKDLRSNSIREGIVPVRGSSLPTPPPASPEVPSIPASALGVPETLPSTIEAGVLGNPWGEDDDGEGDLGISLSKSSITVSGQALYSEPIEFEDNTPSSPHADAGDMSTFKSHALSSPLTSPIIPTPSDPPTRRTLTAQEAYLASKPLFAASPSSNLPNDLLSDPIDSPRNDPWDLLSSTSTPTVSRSTEIPPAKDISDPTADLLAFLSTGSQATAGTPTFDAFGSPVAVAPAAEDSCDATDRAALISDILTLQARLKPRMERCESAQKAYAVQKQENVVLEQYVKNLMDATRKKEAEVKKGGAAAEPKKRGRRLFG
ncbi:hypothetical protein DFS34DRAFT_627181 [Phlyctochytrium arcticum]|nr:hypothetical protein DFS34DRAFT_640760 [Phlyctochytrium arcticum]KAI9095241.1 hypothetical protein DFS34DRAFT_627181 [Phlyctochytrium arcticum]